MNYVRVYVDCAYCATNKPDASGFCHNCGAEMLRSLGTFRGRPVTDKSIWEGLMTGWIESHMFTGLPSEVMP